MRNMPDDLSRAVSAIRQGDRATGRRLLAGVLRADPSHELAWLWMSSVVDTDTQRRDCLQRALAINPHSEAARRGLAALAPSQGAETTPHAPARGPTPTRPIAPAQSPPPQPAAAGRWPVARWIAWGGVALAALLILAAASGAWVLSGTSVPAPPPTPGISPTLVSPKSSAQLEQEYLAQVMQISYSYLQALSLLSERLLEASDDPQLLSDTRWQNSLLTTSAILKANGNSARALQAPPRFSQVQADVLAAAAHFDQVAELVAGFVQDGDPSHLQLATAYMEQGKNALQQAAQKLESLQ